MLSRPVTPQCLDGAIPENLLSPLLALAPRLRWNFGWTVEENKAARYWHHEIGFGGKANTECVRAKVERHPARELHHYVDWLQETVIGRSTLLRYYLNAHTFGVDGSPHTDSDRPGEVTAVTYLHKQWNPVWAGSTVVYSENGDIELAAHPKNNRILVFPSDRLHGPEPLSRFFNGLRIVLVAKFRLS
jgi:hypothetical protein